MSLFFDNFESFFGMVLEHSLINKLDFDENENIFSCEGF
jgi:hypothetical protein